MTNQETSSISGILLPESKEKPWFGTVVAVWEWKTLDNWSIIKPQVQAWDVVYFTKYSPDEIEFVDNWERKKYLVVKSTSLLAKQSN